MPRQPRQLPLNEEFKARRKLLGTQAEAARRLHCSVRYIQKLEAGHAQPSGTLMELARQLTKDYRA